MHPRLLAPAHKELFHSHFVRNFLEGLLRVADRKRHQDGARPRRNLVDIEPEPVGKQHDLRRNRRHRIVIVLSKETEIDLGECIDFGDATHFENLLAGARQRGMIRRKPRELQPEVGLHRSADVRRTAGVVAPASIFILVVQNVPSGLVKAPLAARAEQRMQQDVIGFKGSIGFQFPAPVTLFVLLRKKIIARRVDGYRNPASQVINLSESHLRGPQRARIWRAGVGRRGRTVRGGFFHL